RGSQVTGQQLHRGAFSGPVWAQKSHHLALGNRERDIFDGSKIAIVFGQPHGLDHGRTLLCTHRWFSPRGRQEKSVSNALPYNGLPESKNIASLSRLTQGRGRWIDRRAKFSGHCQKHDFPLGSAGSPPVSRAATGRAWALQSERCNSTAPRLILSSAPP